jgi:hypothetical protein
MRLFLIGCEYAGTTTLAIAMRQWAKDEMGIELGSIHDHWKIPDVVEHYPVELSEEEKQQFLGLSLRMKEAYMRHNLYYHTPHEGTDAHQIIVGYYIEDSIYARMYYGYGGPGMAGDRARHSKSIESLVTRLAPQTVLILVKASAQTIARRMKETPHPYQVIREEDIDRTLRLFDAAFEASPLKNKMVLDTTTASVEETMVEFIKKMKPFITESDRRGV